MSVLAIIPARGGSRQLKNKNLIEFCGKPMIYWTIQAAQKSTKIDRIIVSTDSTQIAEVALSYGCDVPFLRPAELARDESKVSDCVEHLLQRIDAEEQFVLLQPTSPLRQSFHIDECFSLKKKLNARSIVSISKCPFHLRQIFTRDDVFKLTSVERTKQIEVRRQEQEQLFVLNGAIYAMDTKLLNKKVLCFLKQSLTRCQSMRPLTSMNYKTFN